MGIQINGSTDRITAIDGTIDFVSNIGNIGLITASRYELLDSITIGAGSTIIKTVNGKLGIGEDDPDGNTLLIRAATTVGTTKGHIMLTGDSATNGEGPQIVFSESGSGSNFAGAYIGHIRATTNSVGHLVFGTRESGGDANTVPTERLRITSAGAVGINESNPTGKLTITNSPQGFVDDSAQPQATFLIKHGTSGSNRRWVGIGASLTGAWLQSSSPGGTGLSAPFSINPGGGFVGINQTAPAVELDIKASTPEIRLTCSNAALGQGATIGQIGWYTTDPTTPTGAGTVSYINTYSASSNGSDYTTAFSNRAGAGGGETKITLGNALGQIRFYTHASGGGAERLRITNGGDIETKGLNQFNFNSDWSAKARNINVFPCDDVSNWFSFIGTNLRFTDGGNFVKPSDNSNSNWGNIAGIAFEGVNQNNSSGNHPAIRFVVDQPGGNGSNYSLGSGNSGKTAAIDNNTVMCISGNGNVGINAANPNAKLLIIDDSATETVMLKLRNYKSSVNTKPTLRFEASTSSGQGANSSIQGLAGTDAGGAANANDSGMKFIVAYGGSGTAREAFTIKKDGNVYFPAGQGIDFSATSDATGMTSELFSDYERGVHTFSVMGSGGNPTVNIQSGYNKLYYTKIGDMVHVTGEMRWTISSHGSGDLKISIPFTSDSSAQSNCQGTAQTWNVNWAYRTESRDLWSEVSPGHNYMRFRIGGSNSLNEDYLDCGSSYQKTSNSNYGVEYQVSLWYRTG